MHILFQRKNKTIAANLKNDKVCDLLLANYKTFCSLKSMTPTPDIDMKAIVGSILEETRLVDARAAKMDIDDFLRLLDGFHQKGIHFK